MIEYTVRVYDDKTFWYLNGNVHREDGPAFERVDGYKEWWLNGERHRVDGPAVECADGDKEWWVNGERHRVDGPAIENVNGFKAWFLNGVQYTEEEFNAKMNPSKELTVEEISKLLGYEVKVVK